MNTFSTSPIPKLEHYSPIHPHTSMMDPNPNPPPMLARTKSKSKPRKRVNTAEKRHQHNAVERLRRETLNTKFIVLARLVPSLAKSGRPSKSAIVNGSITHMTKQRDQRLLAAKLLRELCAERDELMVECNGWRKSSPFPGVKPAGKVNGWTAEMEEVCAVEKETFGEFANMGDEGEEEDADAEESTEVAPAVAPEVTMGMSMGSGIGIEAANAHVSNFDQRGLYTTARLSEVDPLSSSAGLAIFAPRSLADQPRTLPTLLANRAIEMSWPTSYPFTPALTSEPLSLPHTAGAIPFNAFIPDSLDSDSSPPSLFNMPTPPTSSLLGMPTPPPTDPSRFTHTPSPGSSGSFEDTSNKSRYPNLYPSHQPPSQWNSQQQQLLFLHSMQQQQLQSSQLAEMHHRSMSAITPNSHSSAGGFGRSQSADSGSSYPSNIHNSPLYPTANFQQQHVQMMLQQQQQHSIPIPMGVGSASGQGQGQGNMPRMSNEQLEAWRKIATSGGSGSAGMGGMWTGSGLKGY